MRRLVLASIALTGCGRLGFPWVGSDGDLATDTVLDNGCGFTAVSTGRNQTCAIATGGAVWCWGDNDQGQLGAPASDKELAGIRVPLSGPAAEVGTGKAFSCARLVDNTAWCWGNNDLGTLGDGTLKSSITPVQVNLSGDTAVELEVGGENACARRGSDNAIMCWGRNKSNIISAAGDVMIPQPTVVAGTAGTQYFELGHRHGCGVDQSNEVFCWGRGVESQLGVGTADSATPVRPSGLPSVQSLSLSNRVSCMVSSAGVRCWGTRYLGGASFDTYPAMTYVDNANAVGTSNYAACVVMPDTSILCWGYLFDQTPAGLTTTPTPLSGVTGAISIEGGWDHFCALTTSGLVCWGGDAEGELGRGVASSPRAPMPVAITCTP